MDESRVPWDAGEMHPISGSFKLTRPRARAVRSDCSLTPLARRLHLRGRNSPYLLTALRSWSKCRRPTSPGRSTRGAVRAPGLAFWVNHVSPIRVSTAMAFSLTSTAFTEGSAVPPKYTCDGADVSPPLAWSDAPP